MIKDTLQLSDIAIPAAQNFLHAVEWSGKSGSQRFANHVKEVGAVTLADQINWAQQAQGIVPKHWDTWWKVADDFKTREQAAGVSPTLLNLACSYPDPKVRDRIAETVNLNSEQLQTLKNGLPEWRQGAIDDSQTRLMNPPSWLR